MSSDPQQRGPIISVRQIPPFEIELALEIKSLSIQQQSIRFKIQQPRSDHWTFPARYAGFI